MSKKGFILVDSLLSIVVVTSIAVLTLYTYKAYINYLETYDNYQKRVANSYEDLFSSLGVCEKCEIEEESS